MADIPISVLADPIATGSDHSAQKLANRPRIENITPVGGGDTTIVEVEVEVPVPRAIIYYKRGFYPVSAQFEYWQTNDPAGVNPSGNPLIDITVTTRDNEA